MSLATWKAEFYPIEADEVAEKDAIAHSLQKWLGLTPENLKKHNVTILDKCVLDLDGDRYDPDYVVVGSQSCSLCHHHHTDDPTDEDEDGDEVYCELCPLYKVRGNVACDAERDEEANSPWHHFCHNEYRDSQEYDPKPMIFWLEKAKEGFK